ncbi:MAG: hypothetical protein ACI8UD_002146 [Planctomycetota bacterium]|jgi:hypothetical protein
MTGTPSRALHISLFLVGMLATSTVIRHFDALPFWSSSRQKAAFLAVAFDQVDTLFLGSSRVHRGIIPEVFDHEMQTLGHPCASFNLGLAGSRMHDAQRLLNWVLEQKPRRLQRVFIELHSYDQSIREGQWMSNLMTETHAPSTLAPRLRSIALSKVSVAAKLTTVAYTLAHTVVNALRIGQGARILDDCSRRWSGRSPRHFHIIADRGFTPLDPANETRDYRRRQHDAWVSDPERAASMLDYKRKDLIPDRTHGGFDHEACRAQIATLRDAGIELVYVLMPSYSVHFLGRDGVEDIKDEVKVISFEDPDRHAALYEFELWFDRSHLVKQGAQIFSAELARTYAASLPGK